MVWGGKGERKDLFSWETSLFPFFLGFFAEQLLEKNDLRKDGKASCREFRNGECCYRVWFSVPFPPSVDTALPSSAPWAWSEGPARAPRPLGAPPAEFKLFFRRESSLDCWEFSNVYTESLSFCLPPKGRIWIYHKSDMIKSGSWKALAATILNKLYSSVPRKNPQLVMLPPRQSKLSSAVRRGHGVK